MWSTAAPALSVGDAIAAVLSGRESDLGKRLTNAAVEITEKSHVFRDAAAAGKCWELQGRDFQVSEITNSEMVKVYDNRFVRGVGRYIYDDMMSRAELKLCPLCDYGLVSTLDHFLPKSTFAALVIDPWNLIPVCKDCNYALLADEATSAETEHIHPYFWTDSEGWLVGSLEHLDPPFIKYSVSCPPSWSSTHKERVINHFERLELASRYGTISATGIQEVSQGVRALLPFDSPEILESHLVEQAAALADKFGDNYWRTVMWRTLAQDSWYWQEWIWT